MLTASSNSPWAAIELSVLKEFKANAMLATAIPIIEAIVSATTIPVTIAGVKSIAVRDFVA